jgi:hypothetical protein
MKQVPTATAYHLHFSVTKEKNFPMHASVHTPKKIRHPKAPVFVLAMKHGKLLWEWNM